MRFLAISVNEVEEYRKQGKTKLIDLRSREEYERYHLKDAENIPYEDWEERKGQLSKEWGYILYCERGGSSLRLAKEMAEDGYRVYTVVGGIHVWLENEMKKH